MDVNQTSHKPTKAESLALRYGDGAAPAAGPWNDVIATLLSHRSVRGFLPDTLPPGTLETLIAAAQSASTSSNLQTWSVVAVTGPEKKAALAKIANNQRHIEQCPLFLVWLADLSRNEQVGIEEGVALVHLAGIGDSVQAGEPSLICHSPLKCEFRRS
jgi:nitroreductase